MGVSGSNMALDLLVELLGSVGTSLGGSLVKTILKNCTITVDQYANERAQVLRKSVMFTRVRDRIKQRHSPSYAEQSVRRVKQRQLYPATFGEIQSHSHSRYTSVGIELGVLRSPE